MIDNEIDFAGEVRRLLQADGYVVHGGGPADDPGLDGRFWFTWKQTGMAEAEVGPTRETEAGAWTTALAHRLDNSRIELHRVGNEPPPATMEPFEAARLPEDAFDAAVIARKFGVPHDLAAAQVEQLRRQSVHMNDRYQVNAQTLEAPFGEFVGDVIWLSIKGFLPGAAEGRPLLDELAQMMGGLAYMTGPEGQPLRAGASVIDMGAATYGVIGVMAALRQAEQGEAGPG